jgi:hypothetical protein
VEDQDERFARRTWHARSRRNLDPVEHQRCRMTRERESFADMRGKIMLLQCFRHDQDIPDDFSVVRRSDPGFLTMAIRTVKS